jgi:hypothetical protein
MSRGAQVLGGVLLAAFGVTLALGALEVGVRILHLVPSRFWEPDPLLGTRLIAGKEGWWTQEEHEFIVHVKVNSDGRRDVERDLKKSPDTTRILILGDSFVEGIQVPLEDTLGRQLEKELQPSNIEVFSMAVSGWGTPSQFLYYRDRAASLQADVVLLAFYPGNDVRNNSPTLEPVLPPLYDDGGQLRAASVVPAGKRPRLHRSHAYLYMRKVLFTKQPALLGWMAKVGLIDSRAVRGPTHKNGIPVDYWVYAAERPPEWSDAWARAETLFGELRRAVESRGGRFAILIVTSRDHIYPQSWQSIVDANPAMKEIEWNLEGPERRVLAWCATAHVPCLRLSDTFTAHRDTGETLHFIHDGHWTAAGHALAAQTVAGFLRSDGLVASP